VCGCGRQCSVFITFDPALREGREGEPARARNSDIVEDLGLVEYVFSDKTGTLTSNEMQLRAVAVKDAAFGGLNTRCVGRAFCHNPAGFRATFFSELRAVATSMRQSARVCGSQQAGHAARGWYNLI